MKRILDFNVNMIGADRKPIMIEKEEENDEGAIVKVKHNYTLSENLSTILFNQTKGDLQKFTIWSDQLYNKEILELDAPDTERLQKVIEEMKPNERGEGGMAFGLKIQYMDIFKKAEEVAKEKIKSGNGTVAATGVEVAGEEVTA